MLPPPEERCQSVNDSMRHLALCFIALLTLSSCGKPAEVTPTPAPSAAVENAQPVEGLTTMVKGKVEIQKPGAADWTVLAAKDGILPGSRIRSGADGEADILLADKAAFRVKPNSEIEITENLAVNDGSSRIAVKIDAGRLLHRFDKMPPGSEYRMTTPAAGAVVRGTQFEISADASQTSVKVLTGKVDVENAAGKVQVSEKRGTRVSSGQAPAEPLELAQKEIDSLMECSLVNFTVALQKTRRMATIAEMRNIGPSLDLWATQHDGKYPKTLEEAKISGTDNWGGNYRYQQLDGGNGYLIISNGPDKTPDTDDDLEYRR